MIAVEVIENTCRLREFQSEWSRFVCNIPPTTPFQLPEWLVTWWSHFGGGALRIMAFRHDEQLIGVLPCFLHDWNGRRQLTLVGSGISDYLDPLFDPRYIGPILEIVRAQLKIWGDWDLCDWQDLSADTPLQALGTAVPDIPCSSIPIEQTFAEFMSSRPNHVRHNLHRYRKKAQALGSLKFEINKAPDSELMDALIQLHHCRWAKSGQGGMIEVNRSEGFLREVAELLGSCGLLRIFTLRLADRIVSILLALSHRTTIFPYLSGFDVRYENLGFGRELLSQAICYSHQVGYRQWNFLRGAESYKFAWGARTLAKLRVVILP